MKPLSSEKYHIQGMDSSILEADDSKRVPVVIYARVSDDKQFQYRQIDGLNRAMAGMPAHFYQAGDYSEKRSARGRDGQFNRPEYDKLIAQVRAKQYKVCLIYSLDRFARSVPDFYEQVKIFRANHCELWLVKEHIHIGNKDDPYQKMFMGVLAVFAEFESDLISDRTREQMASHKIRNPFKRYGQPPKITGPNLKVFIKMYYSKKAPALRGGHKTVEAGRRCPFKYSLQNIADYFKVSKGTLSDIINDHVELGTMKLRDADMRRVMPRGTIEGLMIPDSMKKGKADHSKLERRLDFVYWPDEVKNMVKAKYGTNFQKRGNRDTKHAAYKYGVKIFRQWLKENVHWAALHGDISELTSDHLRDVVDFLNQDYDELARRQDERVMAEAGLQIEPIPAPNSA